MTGGAGAFQMVDSADIAALRQLLVQGFPEQAEARARDMRAAHGDSAELQHIVSRSLLEQAEYALALHEATKGLALPGDLAVRTHLRNVAVVSCGQLGLVDMGCALAEASVPEYDTAFPVDHGWPGHLFWLLGENERALAAYRAALTRWPDDCNLTYCVGMVRLAQGDPDGMGQYARYITPEFWRQYYADSGLDLTKMWQGEPLAGRSIGVIQLGGVGDTIQFSRYARILRELGASEVVVQLPSERIRRFMESCADIRLLQPNEPMSTDWWVPSFGLCTQFFSRLGPLPKARYLNAPDSTLADAQLALIRRRARGRRCVAIAWHSAMPDGASRSLPLAEVLPLLGLPNIHWVVTQRGVALRQFQQSGLQTDCSVVSEASSFDDTAALMAGLDGVVTIDSYSLHMAGALGVRAWFLAGRALDWRHLNRETESIWYPSVRLVRQPRTGDWRSAIKDLMGQLRVL